MSKALIILGTRPEAIKLAPVISAFRDSNRKRVGESGKMEVIVCNTGQQRELSNQTLGVFGIKPDIDLDIMSKDQDLFDISARLMLRFRPVLKEVNPSVVIVQGDTTTALIGAVSAFYQGFPVAHVEAGLRTRNKHSPFPEEINRRLVAPVVDFHFAPTEGARRELLREGHADGTIFVTGNTGIDALLEGLTQNPTLPDTFKKHKDFVLLTAHRRENFGVPLASIFQGIRRFAEAYPETAIVYPVHPNPNVWRMAEEWLAKTKNICLIPPVSYLESIALIRDCRFVVTDSGGIQEEAPYLGKPVVVLRESTERQEAVDCGAAVLVGTDADRIYDVMGELMTDSNPRYPMMRVTRQPFGDGQAGGRIVETLCGAFA